MDITEELPTVIAFCAGYGGIERGLDLCGVEHRVLAYVEIEAYCIANLVAKMEAGELPPAPIFTDLKKFPAEIFRDRVDIITGGYPCQPFSSAGKRLGADDPRHLWPHIRRHIESIRPVRCFFENVEGHISLGLSSVISDLEEDGYRTTWGIFSANEVGAPHQRKRVYIMGDTKSGRWRGGSKHTESQGAEDYKERPDQDLWSKTQRSSELDNSNLPHGEGRSVSCGIYEEHNKPDSASELADSRRSASAKSEQQAKLWSTGSGESPGCAWDNCAEKSYEEGQTWPAGAGPGQYEWEEPRVIWKTEPKLGGTVDGSTHRVNRLRLLGNGVVPQTAAKAWVIMSERFN